MNVDHVKSPMPQSRLDVVSDEITALEGSLSLVRARLQRPRAADQMLARMAAMLAACGNERPGTPGFAARVACDALGERAKSIRLNARPTLPAMSVVLCAHHVDAALCAMRDVAPLLSCAGAEMLLADGGDDPEVALLASVVRHLRVIGGDGAARACNAAVRAARAEWVILMDAAESVPRSWVLPPPDCAWVGVAGTARLVQVGVPLGDVAADLPAWRLVVSRQNWEAAGGLDAEMVDGQGLELADLCQKLRLLGVRLVPVGDAALVQVAPPDRVRAWHAMDAFRARWGDSAPRPA